ncbi:MAG: hypothetical protein Tsb0020_49190 [Haliangiales bacterium]
MPHPIAHKLQALRHAQMRCAILVEYLVSERSDAVVESLASAIDSAVRTSDGDAVLLLAVLANALNQPDPIPYQRLRELYTAAKDGHHSAVARLFFAATPARASAPSDDFLEPERPLTPRGRPLTLGERKSLARTHRRDLILHLVRDPHPDVVAILHLTEPDVLVLASRRPTNAQALAHVGAHERWAPRYRVRLALVRNPYSPVPMAVRLATTLRARDLAEIADDTHLAELVREQARELARRR